MNRANDNIYTASGIAQDKKVRVQALGRGVRSKSKLHSPQANHNWKLINASLRVWRGKWGERTVSVVELVPNNRIFAWPTGTYLHSTETNKNWFGRQSTTILILLGFPLLSVMALILLS